MSKKAHFRHEYVIGDIQGCFASLQKLLKHIDFDENKDRLWFAGDLVARGEDSLGALRLVKQLCEAGAAKTVLGNHDINLIAVWRGFSKLRNKDKTAELLQAKDCDELLNWLRDQPLLLLPDDDTVLTHAGLPHIWSVKQAQALAFEVESILSAKLKILDKMLPHLYGSEPSLWSNKLEGVDRLRCIINYFTRMRVVDKHGQLEFSFKGSPTSGMPKGYKPWYDWDATKVSGRKRKVLFGHWAALGAQVNTKMARALDGGCVWGGELVAYRLEDGEVFAVAAV